MKLKWMNSQDYLPANRQKLKVYLIDPENDDEESPSYYVGYACYDPFLFWAYFPGIDESLLKKHLEKKFELESNKKKDAEEMQAEIDRFKGSYCQKVNDIYPEIPPALVPIGVTGITNPPVKEVSKRNGKVIFEDIKGKECL